MGFRGEEEGGEERGRRVGAGGRVDVAADREREREEDTEWRRQIHPGQGKKRKRGKSRLRTRALIMFPLVKRARRSAITRFAFPTS